MGKTRIFVYCTKAPEWGDDNVVGCALAEDGTLIANHISSNESFSKSDMGITSDRKHDVYAAAYPDGYELVWLTNAEQSADSEFTEAIRLHQLAWESQQ